jgi:hypothetical protein
MNLTEVYPTVYQFGIEFDTLSPQSYNVHEQYEKSYCGRLVIYADNQWIAC